MAIIGDDEAVGNGGSGGDPKVVPLRTPESDPAAKAGAKKRASKRAPKPAQTALQPRTPESIADEQTIVQLALRIWAVMIGEPLLVDLEGLTSELLQFYQSDDDEEGDEGWIDEQTKDEKKMLDEAIDRGLDRYPDIAAIDSLPDNPDPILLGASKQLKEKLRECAIGAVKFKDMPRAHLERAIKHDIEKRLKRNPKFSTHVREDVPGTNVKKYGSRWRTSSKGTFAKTTAYEDGGGLDALFTGGYTRIAKDRIDPAARSYLYGLPRKSERQIWLHHYSITERSGKQSDFVLERKKLAGNGAAAVRDLLGAGAHIVKRKGAEELFVRFLLNCNPIPRREIIRMPQVGFFAVDGHYIYVRSNETLLPPALKELKSVAYEADDARDPDQYGHQVKGATADWQREVAIPLRGNSNVALALATSFASALIPFADEQRGGVHLHGVSGIGKSAILAVGESVYGLPSASEHRRAYGRTWGLTPTGLEDLLRFRNHAGLFLDDLQRVLRELRGIVVQMIYAFTQTQKARGGSWRLRGDGFGQVFLLSSGEDSIAAFVGKEEDRLGRERRMPDIPAEVVSGSAFETIDHDTLQQKLPALYRVVIKECHGAPGRDWQMWLVELGAAKIRERIDRERQAFLALPQVRDIERRVPPELRSIIRRFGLYAASLRLAIEANILPWIADAADAGLVKCLERWARQRGNVDPAMTQSRLVTDFLRKLADDLADRFIRIHKVKGRLVPATDSDAAKQLKPEAYDGYLKGDLVLVRPEAWVKRCAGADPVEIARRLYAKGDLLASGKDGKFSKTEQTIGGSDRFYVIRQTALTPSDTSDTSDPEK